VCARSWSISPLNEFLSGLRLAADRGRANFERTLLREEQFTYHQGVIVTHAGERRTIAWRNTLLRDERGEVLGTGRSSRRSCAAA
jgi:hypothetical protein